MSTEGLPQPFLRAPGIVEPTRRSDSYLREEKERGASLAHEALAPILAGLDELMKSSGKKSRRSKTRKGRKPAKR